MQSQERRKFKNKTLQNRSSRYCTEGKRRCFRSQENNSKYTGNSYRLRRKATSRGKNSFLLQTPMMYSQCMSSEQDRYSFLCLCYVGGFLSAHIDLEKSKRLSKQQVFQGESDVGQQLSLCEGFVQQTRRAIYYKLFISDVSLARNLPAQETSRTHT